jgi:hypothetical protein
MSLPRRDVKVWFDDQVHRALRRFCEHKGLTMGEWVEGLVKRELRDAAEDAIVVADLAPLLGVARNPQGSRGTSRDGKAPTGTHRRSAREDGE